MGKVHLAKARSGTPLRDRVLGGSETRRLLKGLRPGEYIYQPTLATPPGFYARYGLDPAVVEVTDCRPDLIACVPSDDGPVLRVIDVKASPGLKLSHRIQATLYTLILGHVLEHTTGRTWEELVRGEVFAPLAMTACGFGPTATTAHPDGTWGHDVKDGAYVPTEEDNPPLIGPAGIVHCSLESWAKFAAAHVGSGPPGWLTKASLDHLHAGITLAGETVKDIALGWGVTRTDPPRLTHSGSNGYNHAEIVVIPRLHAAILVTANAGDERARAAAKEVVDKLVN